MASCLGVFTGLCPESVLQGPGFIVSACEAHCAGVGPVLDVEFMALEAAMVITEELAFMISESGRVVRASSSVVATRSGGVPCR